MKRKNTRAAKSAGKTAPVRGCGWTIGLVTLGCAKNLVDSEMMVSLLRDSGARLVSYDSRPDVLLVNTCAFLASAKKESIDALLEACAMKRAGQCRAVIVAGCLPQLHAGELLREMPEVDAFIGPDNVREITAVLAMLRRGRTGINLVRGSPERVFEPGPDRILLTGGPYAFVRIADGCDHRCSFCAIPMIRGRYRSRPIDGIVREAEGLLERGVVELNLIAQDIASYGKDLGNGNDLPELLRSLCKIGGKFWIRLLYAHPDRMTPGILDAMAGDERVCRYLDLPIQHVSPAILRAMGRRGGAESLAKLVSRIRRALPGIALRTTCITGFPGETEAHFQELLKFIKWARFEHLGVFAYSRESGTRAADLPDRVPARIAREWRRVLLEAQSRVMDRHAAARAGAVEEALLERPVPGPAGTWAARSFREAPEVDGFIRVRGAGKRPGLRAGSFARIRIESVRGACAVAEFV